MTDPRLTQTLSAKAQTADTQPCHRGVDPRKIGYTETEFERQFPGLNYEVVLESFLNFYISKGERSTNWFEKFLAYAHGALRRAREAEATGTDSLGRPLDPNKRRRVGLVPLTENEEREYLAKFKDDQRRLNERRARLAAERKAQEQW